MTDNTSADELFKAFLTNLRKLGEEYYGNQLYGEHLAYQHELQQLITSYTRQRELALLDDLIEAENTEDISSALDDLIDESMDYERGNWTGFVKTPQEREDAIAQVSAHKTHVLDLIEQEANRQKAEMLERLEGQAVTPPGYVEVKVVPLSAIRDAKEKLV